MGWFSSVITPMKNDPEYARNYYHTNDRYYLRTSLHRIKQRCYDPKIKSYKFYGARGITICDEWLKDTDSFVSWAQSHGWSRDLQIDRIDPKGPYSPGNCRWVTSKENNRNRTNNKLDVKKAAEIRKLLIDGVKGPEIAARYGVHHSLIYRIKLKQQWL
jgi:hypothetical protein